MRTVHWLSLVLLCLLFENCSGLNILLFSPGHSNSHVMFNYRLASTLSSHGHRVTVHFGPPFGNDIGAIETPRGVRTVHQGTPELSPDTARTLANTQTRFQETIWKPPMGGRMLSVLKIAQDNLFNSIIAQSCFDESHLGQLRAERFDVALSHYRNFCPLGIAKVMGIEKFVWISPDLRITDFGASIMRIPVASSYNPNANSSFTDRMSFLERVVNWLLGALSVIYEFMFADYLETQDEQFRGALSRELAIRAESVNASDRRALIQSANETVIQLAVNGSAQFAIKNVSIHVTSCDASSRSLRLVVPKPPSHTNILPSPPAPNMRRHKSLRTIAEEQVATMFMNGEQALDYPRPFLPGMAFLGQLENPIQDASVGDTQDWKSIMQRGKDGTILFSLGTIANTSFMPMEMKMAFLDAFKQFPTCSIIWRLEGRMPPGIEHQRHITVVKWLPQKDLLHSGNVKLFIMHGGYNSLVETAQAGVPMLVIPLFGDQPGNAKRVVRLGIGLSLDKSQMDNGTIAGAIHSLLNEARFANRASKLVRFVNDKPKSNGHASVRRIEAISKTRRWPMSPARKMSAFKLYCIDIMSVLCVLMVCVTYAVLKLVAFLARLVRTISSSVSCTECIHGHLYYKTL